MYLAAAGFVVIEDTAGIDGGAVGQGPEVADGGDGAIGGVVQRVAGVAAEAVLPGLVRRAKVHRLAGNAHPLAVIFDFIAAQHHADSPRADAGPGLKRDPVVGKHRAGIALDIDAVALAVGDFAVADNQVGSGVRESNHVAAAKAAPGELAIVQDGAGIGLQELDAAPGGSAEPGKADGPAGIGRSHQGAAYLQATAGAELQFDAGIQGQGFAIFDLHAALGLGCRNMIGHAMILPGAGDDRFSLHPNCIRLVAGNKKVGVIAHVIGKCHDWVVAIVGEFACIDNRVATRSQLVDAKFRIIAKGGCKQQGRCPGIEMQTTAGIVGDEAIADGEIFILYGTGGADHGYCRPAADTGIQDTTILQHAARFGILKMQATPGSRFRAFGAGASRGVVGVSPEFVQAGEGDATGDEGSVNGNKATNAVYGFQQDGDARFDGQGFPFRHDDCGAVQDVRAPARRPGARKIRAADAGAGESLCLQTAK